jgi:hypothetical protein
MGEEGVFEIVNRAKVRFEEGAESGRYGGFVVCFPTEVL